MRIFIPGKRNANPFFEEIVVHSSNDFIYGALEDYEKENFNYILIHWPETLLDWKEPNADDLQKLRCIIEKWKEQSKIVYVLHNEKSHYSNNSNYQELYALVAENSNIMVHLGEYSRRKYYAEFPDLKHVIIRHPLYRKNFVIDKSKAREILGINKDAVVFIAPGKIRSHQEKKMLLNAFRKLDTKNKLLIVPYMYRKNFNLEFPGRQRIKRLLDVKRLIENLINGWYNKKEYLFSYHFKSEKDLSILMSASDVVIVPRKNVLNSGVLFLGMTYKKILVGPLCGNIKEILEEFNMPGFQSDNSDLMQSSFKEALSMLGKTSNYPDSKLQKYEPVELAKEWDKLFL